MKTNYYGYERDMVERKNNRKPSMLVPKLLLSVIFVGIVAAGCIPLPGLPGMKKSEEAPVVAEVPEDNTSSVINVPTEDAPKTDALANYNVVSVGRGDPFMPFGEVKAFDEARSSGIAEANAYNAKIAKINSMKNIAIRLPDDTNPYSYNLPVPPTSLAGAQTAAAKISRTKVVGIMYNKANPSAIINIDDKDYLVRQGDKILDEKYKVLQINQSWITVALGSNTYSAGIGELFSKDDLNKTKNDLYNLENRFGGRKG